MQAQLFRYFISYGKLPLSGIGTFYLEHIPARLDFAGKKLYPPVQAIRFSLENSTVENRLYDYLGQEFGEEQAQIIRRYNDFCYSLRQQLTHQRRISLAGIGWLQKEFLNTYTFTPLADAQDLFPPVSVSRVMYPAGAQATVRQGDHSVSYHSEEAEITEVTEQRSFAYWPALLLVLVALAMVAAYWYQDHSF